MHLNLVSWELNIVINTLQCSKWFLSKRLIFIIKVIFDSPKELLKNCYFHGLTILWWENNLNCMFSCFSYEWRSYRSLWMAMLCFYVNSIFPWYAPNYSIRFAWMHQWRSSLHFLKLSLILLLCLNGEWAQSTLRIFLLNIFTNLLCFHWYIYIII